MGLSWLGASECWKARKPRRNRNSAIQGMCVDRAVGEKPKPQVMEQLIHSCIFIARVQLVYECANSQPHQYAASDNCHRAKASACRFPPVYNWYWKLRIRKLRKADMILRRYGQSAVRERAVQLGRSSRSYPAVITVSVYGSSEFGDPQVA